MKVVLVIASFNQRPMSQALQEVLRLAEMSRGKDEIVLAAFLDRRHSVTASDIGEMRGLEREAIVRKFPDEVKFTDPHAPDVADLVVLAAQYNYGDARDATHLRVA